MSQFSTVIDLARNDLVTSTTINGRRLRLVGYPILKGQLPRVVWSDLLSVARVGYLRRSRLTAVLCRKFAAHIEHLNLDGRAEIAIPLMFAAAALSAEPGLPPDLNMELARAANAAVKHAGDAILTVLPAQGLA